MPTAETWTLIIVILFQGAPRTMSTVEGYSRDKCELAAYTVVTNQTALRKLEAQAWCIPGAK